MSTVRAMASSPITRWCPRAIPRSGAKWPRSLAWAANLEQSWRPRPRQRLANLRPSLGDDRARLLVEVQNRASHSFRYPNQSRTWGYPLFWNAVQRKAWLPGKPSACGCPVSNRWPPPLAKPPILSLTRDPSETARANARDPSANPYSQPAYITDGSP